MIVIEKGPIDVRFIMLNLFRFTGRVTIKKKNQRTGTNLGLIDVMIEIFCCPHFVPALLTTPYHPKRIVSSIFSLILCWRIFSNISLLMNDKWIIPFAPASRKDRSDLYLFPIPHSSSSSSRTHNPEILSLKANGNNGWWQLITVRRETQAGQMLVGNVFYPLNFYGKRNSMETVYGSLFTMW